MRRLFLFFTLFLIYWATNSFASGENLYEKFNGRHEIKVFLEEFINETTNPAVKADVFKNAFKEALAKRQGIKFTIVDAKDKADIIIAAKIKNYIFTENAMPFLFSTASLAADALSPKSTGKLTCDYEVKAPDGKILLAYKNFTTEERRPKDHMKDESGLVHSATKSANRFIHRAFYKPKSR